jgi:hypothetical protein
LLLGHRLGFSIFICYYYLLCGCETSSVTLREGHRLRVSQNRVLRRIFGPKRVEVAGGWRRLHNEVLHNLYASPNFRGIVTWVEMGDI